MRSLILLGAASACATAVHAQKSLADVCTAAFVTNALPLNVAQGITINPSSVTANAVLGYQVKNANMQPDATFDFCNVTFTYVHTGTTQPITLTYWLPAPQNFKNRYLSTGGGGYAFNSGAGGVAMGVPYGALSGESDAGLGTADNLLNNGEFLLANGTINWERVYTFAYEGHLDLATIGKAFAANFFATGTQTIYSYYQGCSEGGREGWSQIQRFSGEFHGVITGAPAFRLPFQQVQHLYSGMVEQTMGYFPTPCALEKIMNETIIACDPMDGLTDGVVARSDLCMLNYDISVQVGLPYSCSARTGSFQNGYPVPAVSGTLTKKDIQVAKKMLDGLHDSRGRRAYFTYQPGCTFTDGYTAYNSTSGTYYAPATSLGGGWVTEALQEVELQNLPSLAGLTYQSLVDFINQGLNKYYDSLLTTWPDLTPFYNGGGKVLHYHGESDYSIPTASSVRYFESVRQTMYPNLTMLDGSAAMSSWYKLYLVPGAGHCAPNAFEPNGPFPQTNLQVMINWVEKGQAPTTLNATHLAGPQQGANAQICAWPYRPLWTNGTQDCVFDKKSYNSWTYNLNAFEMPIY